MSSIINFDYEEPIGTKDKLEKVAVYYGKKSVTYGKLTKDVAAIVKQLENYKVDETTTLFLFMDNIYLKILAILASNQLKCTVIPYFETYVPDFSSNLLMQEFVVIADEKSTGKLGEANIAYKALELPENEEDSCDYTFVYESVLKYGTYDLSATKQINFHLEENEMDLRKFISAIDLDLDSSLCINGCNETELFLLEVLGVFMQKASIYYLQRNIEYNPCIFFEKVSEKQIKIINITPFSIRYLYQLKEYARKDIELLLSGLKQFILINDETVDELTEFKQHNETRIYQYEKTDKIRPIIDDVLEIDSKEEFILELVYRLLKTVVMIDTADIKVEDDLISWGITSLNFVQMIVQLENILDIEFEDDVFELTLFPNLLSLVKCITEQWNEMSIL